VCVSAPGGAVAPVPTWTLQRRMLGIGTSMASPSASGGTTLLISAMKVLACGSFVAYLVVFTCTHISSFVCMICIQAEGIPVSPYCVRKALENIAIPIGDLPEDKLSTGQGLMQVDK